MRVDTDHHSSVRLRPIIPEELLRSNDVHKPLPEDMLRSTTIRYFAAIQSQQKSKRQLLLVLLKASPGLWCFETDYCTTFRLYTLSFADEVLAPKPSVSFQYCHKEYNNAKKKNLTYKNTKGELFHPENLQVLLTNTKTNPWRIKDCLDTQPRHFPHKHKITSLRAPLARLQVKTG